MTNQDLFRKNWRVWIKTHSRECGLLEGHLHGWNTMKCTCGREALETHLAQVQQALQGIVDAAIEHGVNDKVGAAIAHAELIGRNSGR